MGYDRGDSFPFDFLNQMEFHLVQNRKENCNHDHIPFNLKRNRYIFFSMYYNISLLFRYIIRLKNKQQENRKNIQKQEHCKNIHIQTDAQWNSLLQLYFTIQGSPANFKHHGTMKALKGPSIEPLGTVHLNLSRLGFIGKPRKKRSSRSAKRDLFLQKKIPNLAVRRSCLTALLETIHRLS